MQFHLVDGDISKVPADALITAINPGGAWFGRIDGVIQKCAGNLFHSQAEAAMPLTHAQAIVALAGNRKHRGAFKNVVFVVDALHGRLRNIVFEGLVAAANARFKKVSLPAIRMGVMLGVVEKTPVEAVYETITALKIFSKAFPESQLNEITLVVYNDKEIYHLFEELGADINR